MNGKLSAALGVRAVPSTLVLDQSGTVRYSSQGIVRSEELQSVLRDVCVHATPAKPGELYLTFDDFPALPGDSGSSLSTDELLLDILRAAEVPATFFCIGSHLQTPAGSAVARRAVREGHQLQLHSWDHDSREPQLARCLRFVREISPQRPPTLYRPPGSSALQDIQGRRTIVRGPTINPFDFSRPGQPELLRRVLQTVKSGGVIQLHAGVTEVREVLPTLLQSLRRRRYTFALLS
jgi:peptidoglycan/xylan/chitin deacetylase (PgdA/CDA1 family)